MVLLYILEMSTLINISHPAAPNPKLAGDNDDEPLPTDGPDDIHAKLRALRLDEGLPQFYLSTFCILFMHALFSQSSVFLKARTTFTPLT